MSQFSDAFSGTFDVSVSAFGESCKIDGAVHPCIIHDLNSTNMVAGARPGRVQEANGSIVIKASVWTAVRGKKGKKIVINGDTFRVLNEPEVGYSSDTVTLLLAATT